MKSIIFTAVIFGAALLAGCQGSSHRTTDSPVITTKKGVSQMSPVRSRPAVEAAYSQFIDVRTPEEYSTGHAYRAKNIPLDTLRDNLDRLDKNEPVYIIDAAGNISMEAAEILVEAGFSQAISISGGTAAWKDAGLPMVE